MNVFVCYKVLRLIIKGFANHSQYAIHKRSYSSSTMVSGSPRVPFPNFIFLVRLLWDSGQRELERPAADPHFGKRIHAWVVLLPGSLGPRGPEVQEPVFIEPSTGVSYSTIALETANVYLGVESVWNNCNYWVNMQECTEACTKLEWNLSNIRHWEHLLPGEPESMRNVDDDEDEEVNTRREFHLVMPASYVDRLQIPYQVYEERYPNGKKTVYYKKSKVELFAPYLREDGLIELVTVFDDYEYQKALYIYKKYQNRSDKLTISEVDLSKDFTTDYYANGRADACHVHQYFSGNADAVDEERTLEFYDTKRLDDLISIRMHSLYASQDYKHRHDRLYNRYVDYSPIREAKDETIIHDRMITKIVEKFHRNEEIPACKDIAIREFDFLENEIRLTYHYEVGQYTQATRTFIKPPVTERGDRLVFLPEMTHGYNPNLLASPEDFDDLIDELIKQLNEEDISCAEIRHVEAEVSKFLQTREIEYAKPKLLISLFDPIRNDEAKAELFALEEKMKIQSEREMDEEIDFVSPYIARLGNLKYLTKNQALKVKEDCINDFKQAMVNRANSILREFDKYSNEMEKFQKIITQSENLPREDKEEMLENINKITIKLRALEVRLNRHRKLVPNRYRKLLQSLQQNKQISILYDE